VEIKGKIKTKKHKLDKNNNEYLVLETGNKENILVFPKKINTERWQHLQEKGCNYTFLVEQGNISDRYILTDFHIEIEIPAPSAEVAEKQQKISVGKNANLR
jgi:hypothetical protein